MPSISWKSPSGLTGAVGAVILVLVVPILTVAGTAPFVVQFDTRSSVLISELGEVVFADPTLVIRHDRSISQDVNASVEASKIRIRVHEVAYVRGTLLNVLIYDEDLPGRVVEEVWFDNASMTFHDWRSRSSFLVHGFGTWQGHNISDARVHVPRVVDNVAGPASPSFNVAGHWEPFSFAINGLRVPVPMMELDDLHGSAWDVTAFNMTATVRSSNGTQHLDPYRASGGGSAPGTVPLRWVTINLFDGHVDVSVNRAMNEPAEFTLYSSSVEVWGANYVRIGHGDGQGHVDGTNFTAMRSMLTADGLFDITFQQRGAPGLLRVTIQGSHSYLQTSTGVWFPEPGSPLVAIGASVLVAGLVVLRDLIGRYLGALWAPAYSKLRKPSLLDHERRHSLFEMIRNEPGVTFLQLHDRLKEVFGRGGGFGFGSLSYHLSQLERFGMIVSKREGRFRRYFENGGRFGRDNVRIALLQTPPMPDLVRLVVGNPGASQLDLHARLRETYDVSRQTVGYHLKRLAEKDLVAVAPNGRSKAYSPTEKLLELIEFAEERTVSLRDLRNGHAVAKGET